MELVVRPAYGGSSLSAQAARAAIWGYGLGLDMTRRDRQAEMKKSRPSHGRLESPSTMRLRWAL